MTATHRRRRCPGPWLLIPALAFLVHCGGGGLHVGKNAVDASPNHAADGPGQDRSDTGADVSPDASPDASPDLATDGSPDGGLERATDRGLDQASDSGVDQTADPGLDTAFGLDLGGTDAERPDAALVEVPPSETGTLKLFAGQLGGTGDRDGIGTTARFNFPWDVTTDGRGTLFVADYYNHSIRKVDIATREVTTLAGSLEESGSRDGIGNAARFSEPTGITYDGDGNLFVTDGFNFTIRKVVIATGAVTTVAGTARTSGYVDGIGTSARFVFPTGVASDGTGNLFVADSGNSTLRKIVVATGEVTTLAGSADKHVATDGVGSAAHFDGLGKVACDRAGNVFVADSGANTIRKVVVATGAVTTLAGGGPYHGNGDGTGTLAYFDWPNGVTYDGAGNLFVTDGGTRTIRQVNIATGVVTTLAGSIGQSGSTDGIGTAARFSDPAGVTSDGAGKLFVAEVSNNCIRQIDVATGTVTTLAGTAPALGSADGVGDEARFASPRGMASDGTGNLFVADQKNHTIRRLRVATAEATTLAGSPGASGASDGVGAAARFNVPTGVASDRKGNLFVADTESSTIRKIVVDTATVTTLAGAPGVSDYKDGKGSEARFKRPTSLAYDGAGNLFVVDETVQNIRKVDIVTGVVTTFAGSALSPTSSDGARLSILFERPTGLASDGAGNLFVADEGEGTIHKCELATGAGATLAGSAGNRGFVDGKGAAARFTGLADMVTDSAGNLYISDYPNHAIRKLVIATGTVTTPVGSPGGLGVMLGPLPAQLNTPAGLVFEPGAGLFIADAEEDAILLAQF